MIGKKETNFGLQLKTNYKGNAAEIATCDIQGSFYNSYYTENSNGRE
jgi:hypothetical protein